ncbi:MAG: DUF2637 domain-containing protein [Micromonosporaceae bacterium]
MTTLKITEGAHHTGGLPAHPHRSARLIAWCAFTLGVAASIAANVAHARPELGPRLASAFAPVALLLTVEIMSRVPWPDGRWWKLGRWAGTGTVAAVAAITSYRHMSALLASYGEDRLTAIIQPACVDGLMVVASLALLALGHPHNTATTAGGDAASTETSWRNSTHSDHEPVPAATTAPETVTAQVPAALAMSAQMLAASHEKATGQPITVATLADQLGVDHHTARQLLGAPAPVRVNGHHPAVTR